MPYHRRRQQALPRILISPLWQSSLDFEEPFATTAMLIMILYLCTHPDLIFNWWRGGRTSDYSSLAAQR